VLRRRLLGAGTKATLSAMLALNRNGSCGTNPIRTAKDGQRNLAHVDASTKIVPGGGFRRTARADAAAWDFPEPVAPTMAVRRSRGGLTAKRRRGATDVIAVSRRMRIPEFDSAADTATQSLTGSDFRPRIRV
jgi:hypothetical protein